MYHFTIALQASSVSFYATPGEAAETIKQLYPRVFNAAVLVNGNWREFIIGEGYLI